MREIQPHNIFDLSFVRTVGGHFKEVCDAIQKIRELRVGGDFFKHPGNVTHRSIPVYLAPNALGFPINLIWHARIMSRSAMYCLRTMPQAISQACEMFDYSEAMNEASAWSVTAIW